MKFVNAVFVFVDLVREKALGTSLPIVVTRDTITVNLSTKATLETDESGKSREVAVMGYFSEIGVLYNGCFFFFSGNNILIEKCLL